MVLRKCLILFSIIYLSSCLSTGGTIPTPVATRKTEVEVTPPPVIPSTIPPIEYPTPTPIYSGIGDSGSTTGGYESFFFTNIEGYVYDINGDPVASAEVKVYRYIDNYLFPGLYPDQAHEVKTDSKGKYLMFILARNNAEIRVSKNGYKTVLRTIFTEIIKGGSEHIKLDFGGANQKDKAFALEKIN